MAISASYEKNGTQAVLPQAKAKRGARAAGGRGKIVRGKMHANVFIDFQNIS